MDLKTAKEYFDLDVICKLYAVRDPMTVGWLLVLEGKDGRSWTLQTAKRQDKAFKSLDTLVGEVDSITGGVSSLTIGG